MTATTIDLPTSPDAPLLLHGDCLDLLASLLDASVHVVVTDPPAGIGFMHDANAGRTWDSFTGYKPRTARGREVAARYGDDPLLAEAYDVLLGLSLSSATEGLPAREDAARIAAALRERYKSPLARMPAWALGFVAFMVDVWTEVDRVLKPGGWVCAWALPKTADLAGQAMRAVGWTVFDSVLHLFGQGLPKGQNISKAIDKMAGADRELVGNTAETSGRTVGAGTSGGYGGGIVSGHCRAITAPATDAAQRWDGWNTQLAPGHEQWLIAQKDIDGVDPERLREITGCDYAWSPKRLDLSKPKVRAAAFKRWPELEAWAAQAEADHAERLAAWETDRARASDALDTARAAAEAAESIGADDIPDMVGPTDALAEIEAAKPRAPMWSQSTGRSLRPGHGDVLRLLLDGVPIAEQPAGKFKRAKIKTIAANVLAHHTGALHVDACRIPRGDKAKFPEGVVSHTERVFGGGGGMHGERPRGGDADPTGSWPRNVLLTCGGEGCPAEALDRQSGTVRSGGKNGASYSHDQKTEGWGNLGLQTGTLYADSGGASRFFTRFDAPTGSYPRNVLITCGGDDCPAEALDKQAGARRSAYPGSQDKADAYAGTAIDGQWATDFGMTRAGASYSDSGGASRYFTRLAEPVPFDDRVGYFPKASDRTAGLRSDIVNGHPTHKSVSLMAWLVRLLAAKADTTGGEAVIVLDPFMGSGTTGVACIAERVRFIGIERDASSYEVARARVLAAIGSPEAAAEANEAAPTGAQLALL